ncbi:MAG TPA: DMT family transporter [Spirochaetia bacterium]|nr:DMT family transporter [Spirochaetia bacterium]
MRRSSVWIFSAMCVIWGIPYFLIRVSVAEISPVVLVFARTTIGALILMPVVIARGGLRAIGRAWVPLLAFAVAEVGGPWFLLSSAEQHISSSLAGLLISSTPLLGILIAPLFGNREGMGPLGIAGLALGLLGVAAIVGLDFQASDTTALLQMALVAVGYALGPAIVRRYLGSVPSVTVTGVSLLACAVAYAPLAVLNWPATLPSASVFVSVAVLGLVCTATAFLLFFALIERVGPVRATVITYVNPAVAALVGVAVLHETFTVGMGVGFVLVLAGSILATRLRSVKPVGPAR